MSNLLECAQTGDAATARRLVEGVLADVFPPGFVVKVLTAGLDSGRMVVKFSVRDGASRVMATTRVIDGNRKVTTDHDIQVSPAYQGNGYVTASTKAMEAAYASCGIQEIHILANGGGAYMWAKADYLFRSDADAVGVLETIQRRTQDADLLEMCAVWLSGEPLPTPREIAEWAGKDAIRNTVWRGVKYLAPAS